MFKKSTNYQQYKNKKYNIGYVKVTLNLFQVLNEMLKQVQQDKTQFYIVDN